MYGSMPLSKTSAKIKKRFDDEEWNEAFNKDKEDFSVNLRMSDDKFIANFSYSKNSLKDSDYANHEQIFDNLESAMTKIKSFFELEKE